MAVKPYKIEDTEYFHVSINIRSTRDRTIRVALEKRGFESIAEAQKAEKQLYRKAHEILKQKEFQGDTWESLIHKWYAFCLKHRVVSGNISPLSLADYRNTVMKWTEGLLNRAAQSLSYYDLVKCFSTMRESGMSSSHQLRVKRILKQIFDFGMKDGLLHENFRIPTHEIQIKRDEEKRPEILTISEIQKLIELAMYEKHEWRYVWAFALLTGMRSGEMYALEWTDVDFENMLITVSKSYNGRLKAIKSTKAGYWRDVPISIELEKILRTLKLIAPNEKHVFPRSTLWQRGSQAMVLRSFCLSKGLPSIKFHALRACFATQLIRQGVEPAKVMKVCGWKDLKTMQYYIRLAGIEIKGVTDKLSILPPTETMANVIAFHNR